MTITVPVPPSANRWHRNVGGRMLLSSEARKYLAALPAIVAPQRVTLTSGTDLRVDVVWYRESKRGDVDKRGAILLDALQGIAYTNDAQIADYRIRRDDSDRRNPRMVVTITPLDP